MGKGRMSKACEFSPEARKEIIERDGGCIFCKIDPKERTGFQIMHYIPRSRGGLGIPQNGAVGCLIHHQMLDNGADGKFMRQYFKTYLEAIYGHLDEDDLIYKKWRHE